MVSAPYSAVRECVPTVRLLTWMLHVPDASVHVPIEDEPFLNVIVPVAELGDTAAVNVTDEPTVGFAELDVKVVAVDNCCTVTVIDDDVAEP